MRTQLLTHAEAAIRRVGFSRFSYADLARCVGIRKSSIHHHFPTKENLGETLVEAYIARFNDAVGEIYAASSEAPLRLRAYAGLFRVALQAEQGCLCGVLASELSGLPDRMHAGVRRFFELNVDWLAIVITEGQAAKSIRADVSARSQATSVLAGLEGAILVGGALGSIESFDAVVAAMLTGLEIWPAYSPPPVASGPPTATESHETTGAQQ